MRILGLDLSLRSTGYVLLDEGRTAWFGSVGDDKLADVARLAMFDGWIRAALKQHEPAAIALEDYSYGTPQAMTRAFSIGELGGIVKLAIAQAGIPMHLIAINTWKATLCGKAGLKKDLVRLELFRRHGVEFASQDTLDAWAVAETLRRQLLGLDKPEPKKPRRSQHSGQQSLLHITAAHEEARDQERASTSRRRVAAQTAKG